jgi:hypothetical protein
LAGESSQEGKANGAVDVTEQADRAGQRDLQMGTQLVGHRDPGVDQVFAGPNRHPQ